LPETATIPDSAAKAGESPPGPTPPEAAAQTAPQLPLQGALEPAPLAASEAGPEPLLETRPEPVPPVSAGSHS
jgi:hypothetical protein